MLHTWEGGGVGGEYDQIFFEAKPLFAHRLLDDLNSSLEACEAFTAILASNPVLFSRRVEILSALLTVNGQNSCGKERGKEKEVAGRRKKEVKLTSSNS